ncbi:MAG TPA: NnrS family protein [Rhodanobacteraceae bacterium]|nr:NnrS family protein [Rhodanobacteraceae bacterium]
MSSIPLSGTIRRAPLPFRPLFLCAALFATLGMLAWGLFLHLGWNPSAALAPIPWHAHAMLYGFAGALIGGFVLTASGHWTGIPTTTALTLALVTSSWLAARIALLLAAPLALGAVFDVFFLLLVTALVARVVLLSNNRRNFFLVAILLGYAALDVWFYIAVAKMDFAQVTRALLDCVDLLTVLMLAIGGRVIPFFTGRKMPQLKMTQFPPLNIAVNAGAAILLLLGLASVDGPPRGACMLIVAALAFLRLLGWRGWGTLREPMLWVLHLGYLWLVIGLIVRGLGLFGIWNQPEIETLHGITVGALGTLSLGMMTRVSVGHSGREIRANAPLIFVFILPTVAAVLRLAIGPAGWIWAACVWILAFLIWLIVMTPVLVRGVPKGAEAVRT